MGTAAHPIVIDDDHGAPLPSYLARHIQLGFDSDDVAALLSSIDSSQTHNSQSPPNSLPYLPAEILLHILGYVPIDYVLEWRLVCRGFRDAIDGRVLYDYVRRAELIGYIGPRSEGPMLELNEEDYEKMRFVRARFLRMKDNPTEAERSGPRWNGIHAVFGIDDGWKKSFEWYCFSPGTTVVDSKWDPVVVALEQINMQEYGMLRWCLKLDKAVLDLDFSLVAPWYRMAVDIRNMTIVVEWKILLFAFLKTEMSVRKMMEEKRDSSLTFSLPEDCLRAVRRQRLRAPLDRNDRFIRQLLWAMNTMCPLFGAPRYDRASPPWDRIERAEDEALKILLLLRKEASMSAKEIVYLQQLAADRAAMAAEHAKIATLFATWEMNLYGAQSTLLPCLEFLPYVERNPVAWSDATRVIEEARVQKWRSQRKTMERLVGLLKSSNEVLEVPEDAFDDFGSEI